MVAESGIDIASPERHARNKTAITDHDRPGDELSRRVLFVSYTSDWTGPTRSLQLLLSHLPRWIRPTVLLPGDGPVVQQFRANGLETLTIADLGRRRLPHLAGLIAKGRFDLVYGNTADGAIRNVRLASRWAKTPFVCHLRGPASTPNTHKLKFLSTVDAAIAVSAATATAHRRFLGETPCTVVHNGISLDSKLLQREDARRMLTELADIPDNRLILLSLGHLCERKNQLATVRVMKKVASGEKCHLILFGRTDREEAYTRQVDCLIDELDLRDRVSVVGFVDNVADILAGADLMVHTALRDPHPRAVIEAMWAGLPVAAFDVDGVGETIVDGETGFLAPADAEDELAQSIVAVLRDPDMAASLGQAGRRRAQERFDATATAKGVADVIADVFHRHEGEEWTG